MKQSKNIIAGKVAKVAGGSTYGEIKNKAIENLGKSLGKDIFTTQQLTEMIEAVPSASLRQKGLLNWTNINSVREQLGVLIGDNNWLKNNPTEKIKATKALYTAMADLLKKSTGTTDDFARYSNWIQTKKVVDNAIDELDKKYGLGLYDIISGTGGAIIGGLTGEGSVSERLKRAAIGGGIGLGVERLATSPTIKTGIAQIISKIGKIPTDTTGRISKTAVLNLISKLTSEEPETKPNDSE